MLPPVYLAHPGMALPLRVIPVHGYELTTDYILDLEIVATQNVTDARIGCDQAGWLHVSSDGGSVYNPIPTDVEAGVQLGPMTAGDRDAIKIKVSIASGLRRKPVELYVGYGT